MSDHLERLANETIVARDSAATEAATQAERERLQLPRDIALVEGPAKGVAVELRKANVPEVRLFERKSTNTGGESRLLDVRESAHGSGWELPSTPFTLSSAGTLLRTLTAIRHGLHSRYVTDKLVSFGVTPTSGVQLQCV